MKAKPAVHLHIDRLVVDGSLVGPGQSAKLRAEVEAELSRLLRAGGLPLAQSGAVPSASAPPFEMPTRGQSSDLGKRVAHSVYASLK
jgi:hypothetical protein